MTPLYGDTCGCIKNRVFYAFPPTRNRGVRWSRIYSIYGILRMRIQMHLPLKRWTGSASDPLSTLPRSYCKDARNREAQLRSLSCCHFRNSSLRSIWIKFDKHFWYHSSSWHAQQHAFICSQGISDARIRISLSQGAAKSEWPRFNNSSSTSLREERDLVLCFSS